MGSVGMASFAIIVWKLLPQYPAVWVLVGALALWLAVSVTIWRGRELSIDLFA